MLSQEDNDILSRVGPGTPMGELMRHYWIPAALSSELLTPDGDPMRLRILGENLIAFRTTSGKVGVVQNHCPHRGASLFFARNEEDGLRCVYHGWKFDVNGQCVDMPNEPAESNFKNKVKALSYRVEERGGVIWLYMGPNQAAAPALPELEANMQPEGEYSLGIFQRECNYMQALEGDIDTGHTVFLHTGHMTIKDAPAGSWGYAALADRAPRYEAVDTNAGTMYTAFRPAGDDVYYRIAQFLFPFYTMIPTGVLGLEVRVRAWVPIDDGHCFGLGMHRAANTNRPGGRQFRDPTKLLPNSTDWLGRFRTEANARNDFLVDRDKQRRLESYTGLPSVTLEDQAITESMGDSYDRTAEHLGTSDTMIIRTRRRMIQAAKALREHGALPPASEDPKAYAVRSGGVLLPKGVSWVEGSAELRKAFVDHPELNREVLGGIPAV
ncbi:MAG TPA: Rieske 2Fe-2S domain-containing protein [Chloroflexota bacterium]|nr:Rieske 2Fe-2S domain-containing protein [Chloroflexota bacterium]